MMPRLVTGLFYDRIEAENAVEALRAQGIPAEDIYLETEVAPPGEIGRKGGEVSRLEQERLAELAAEQRGLANSIEQTF